MEQQGTHEILPIGSIIIEEGFNVYAPTKGELFDTLQDSLSEFGQIQNIVVNRTDTGDYLVSGEQRLRALMEADAETVECKVFEDMTAVQKAEISVIENEHRRKPSAMDKARGMKRLSELGRSTAHIATLYGVSDDTVRRHLKLMDLPNEVQAMIERSDHALPIHQATFLAHPKLSRSDQLQLARQIAPMTGPVMSEKEAAALIDDFISGPKLPDPGPKAPSAPKSEKTPTKPTTPPADPPATEPTGGYYGQSGLFVIKNDVIVNPVIWRLDLPETCKVDAEIRYGRRNDDWFNGISVSTPTASKCGMPNVNSQPYFTSSDAAGAAFDEVVEFLGECAEMATKTNRPKILKAAVLVAEMRDRFLETPDDGSDAAGWPIPCKVRFVIEGTMRCTDRGPVIEYATIDGQVDYLTLEPMDECTIGNPFPAEMNEQLLARARRAEA